MEPPKTAGKTLAPWRIGPEPQADLKRKLYNKNRQQSRSRRIIEKLRSEGASVNALLQEKIHDNDNYIAHLEARVRDLQRVADEAKAERDTLRCAADTWRKKHANLSEQYQLLGQTLKDIEPQLIAPDAYLNWAQQLSAENNRLSEELSEAKGAAKAGAEQLAQFAEAAEFMYLTRL